MTRKIEEILKMRETMSDRKFVAALSAEELEMYRQEIYRQKAEADSDA